MKNKEIEELLNELKEVTNSKKLSSTYCITNKHWQLLLSHIEQLEKDNKDLDKENQILFERNLKLQTNIDKAIEYVEEKGRLKYNPNELIDILKGDSDD